MALPSTQKLNDVIVDILSKARNNGQLSQLTVRIVRQELATRIGLEEDVLKSEKYKSFIKETVHATMNSLRHASDMDEKPPPLKAPKKEKLEGTAKAGLRKRRSKFQVHSSVEESPTEGHALEADAPPTKKASGQSKPSKSVKSSKTSKTSESEVKYKSKAIIESSDEEAPSATQRAARSPKKKMTLKPSSSIHKQQQKIAKDDLDVKMNTNEGPGPSSSNSKSRSEAPDHSTLKKGFTGDPMESELSSVIDEPPKKRQKKHNKEPMKPQKDEKMKRGKKKEALSKDEETVNRLKSIVNACGVRKVWKKEFEGLEMPSKQIKRLHSILGDLGMTPRYSMEKAKTIREQRELAQELKDVQDFEKAIKRREMGLPSLPETDESADQCDSDADVPVQKRHNARASIMAFLQDQSEEE